MAPKQKIKEEELESALKNTFQPIHALHFEELTKIWEADRRIPSVNSRRAWAEVRNLNPVNVHSWWYRRRPLAKKLKIKIPRQEYELDVGTPPVIPPPEEVKKDQDEELLCSESTLPVDMRSSPFSGTEPTTSETCVSEPHIFAKDPLFEQLAAEMDAYTQASSHTQFSDLDLFLDSSLCSTSSRETSPLPPSSPPPSSPPLYACTLTLPEDIITEDSTFDEEMNYSLGRGDWLLDASVTRKTCSSISYMPYSPFNRPANVEELELTTPDNWMLIPIASWCLGGYRLTYDGCCIGICCCKFQSAADYTDN